MKVNAVAFSPDCLYFATAGAENKIFVWSYSTFKLEKIIEHHCDSV